MKATQKQAKITLFHIKPVSTNLALTAKALLYLHDVNTTS